MVPRGLLVMRQDKVGDFSSMSPDKLLLETQKALSFDQLYAPHAKLIDLQDSVSRLIRTRLVRVLLWFAFFWLCCAVLRCIMVRLLEELPLLRSPVAIALSSVLLC